MSGRTVRRVVRVGLVACLLTAAPVAAQEASPPPEDPAAERPAVETSDRSRRLARLDCRTALSRRELTLFANGTVRLREGEPGEEEMALAELGPDELDDAVAMLDEVDLSETDAEGGGPRGEWIQRCTLVLTLPGREREERSFRQFDSQSLALSRAVAILDGIAIRLAPPRESADGGGAERLPPDYRPRLGDVLRHADGVLYRVEAFTADGEGVELQGVEQPLVLYVSRGQMGEAFVELVRRGR